MQENCFDAKQSCQIDTQLLGLFRCFFWSMIAVVSLSQADAIDENNDGMSDVWQRFYSIDAAEAHLDFDSDGASNLAECNAGTNPWDPESKLSAKFTVGTSGPSNLQFSWYGVGGMGYQAETSTDLRAWSNWGSVVVGADTDVILSDSSNAVGKKFYRVATREPLDSDDDGFSDAEEAVLGSNPSNPDNEPSNWGILKVYGSYYDHPDWEPTPLEYIPDAQAPARSPAMAPEPPVRAPVSPALVSEVVSVSAYKDGWEEFLPSNPPERRIYRRKVTTSQLPGSPLGGEVTKTMDFEGNVDLVVTGNPIDPSNFTTVSQTPTTTVYSGTVAGYSGTATVTVTLSDEYTTAQLVEHATSQYPAWVDNFEEGEISINRDISDDQMTFECAKVRYKLEFDTPPEANALERAATLIVKFSPEKGEPSYNVSSWSGYGNETPVYTIDPQTQNSASDGSYTVYILPGLITSPSGLAFAPPYVGSRLPEIVFNLSNAYGLESDPDFPEDQPVWEYQQFKDDGTWTDWSEMSSASRGSTFWINYTQRPGIFRHRAVFDVFGTHWEAYRLRSENEQFGDGMVGQHDPVGYPSSDRTWTHAWLAQMVMNGHLGQYENGGYGLADQLPVASSPLNSTRPWTGSDVWKCNAFVADVTYPPNINPGGLRTYWWGPWPPVANQWAGVVSTNIGGKWTTEIPGWQLMPIGTYPQPGWVAANGNDVLGHCGVVDYDGRVIAAGRYRVHKRAIQGFFNSDGKGKHTRTRTPNQ